MSWFSVFWILQKNYQTGRRWDILMCIYMPKIITVWHNFAESLYQ